MLEEEEEEDNVWTRYNLRMSFGQRSEDDLTSQAMLLYTLCFSLIRMMNTRNVIEQMSTD